MRILQTARQILTSRKYRPIVALAVLGITILLIGRFFILHPEYLRELKHVNPLVVLAIIVMYALTTGVLIWVYDATFKLCGRAVPFKENALLTSYSTIINFFGPLQSGPGVRAAYLKTRHGLRLRDYTLATLIYYGLFAFFSALFLLGGSRPWWQTTVGLLIVAVLSIAVIRWFMARDKRAAQDNSHFALRAPVLASLMAATLTQLLLSTIIYFIELRAINPSIHFSQAVSYTGAAGFSLYVSLTPGAIGFRETFLVFSQQLHHVSTANILSANLIDRGSYILFLLILLGFVIGTHTTSRLRLAKLPRTPQGTHK